MPEVKKPDEFHGQGGTYVVENGERRLVEGSRTDMNPKVKIDPATGARTLMTEAEIAAEAEAAAAQDKE